MQAIHPGATSMRVPTMQNRTMQYSARRPSRRVYRRRRLAVLFFTVVLAFLAWSGLRQLADTSGGAPLSTAGRSVSDAPRLIARSKAIVQPGDTLWSIARRVQPAGDVRPLVSKLIDHYGGQPLYVGQTIEIP